MLKICCIAAVGLIFLGQPALAKLPDLLIDIIKHKQQEVQLYLSQLDSKQQMLLLDRFSDLLPESELFAGIKIEKEELRAFLARTFPITGIEAEGHIKKSKVSIVEGPESKKYVASLLKGLRGNVHGNLLNLNFSCGDQTYNFPIKVQERKNEFNIFLNGVGIPQELSDLDSALDEECLSLTTEYKSEIVEILALASKKAACPIPATKAGDCLLLVAEQLSKAMGKKRLEVTDQSDLKCKLNKESAELRRLGTYRNGKGWYEMHKYEPVFRQDEAASRKEYTSKQEKFFEYKLALVIQDAQKISEERLELPGVKTLFLEKAESFLAKNENSTFAQFMSWLWDEDCVSYLEIDNGLLWTLEIYKLFPKEHRFAKILK